MHVHLLVESGIHIMEGLNLEELAAAGARVFLFVAAPLKIRGGTGSPIRPFAVVFGDRAEPAAPKIAAWSGGSNDGWFSGSRA